MAQVTCNEDDPTVANVTFAPPLTKVSTIATVSISSEPCATGTRIFGGLSFEKEGILFVLNARNALGALKVALEQVLATVVSMIANE